MFPFKIHFLVLNYPVEFGPYALCFFLAAAAALAGCMFFAVKRGFRARQIGVMLAVMLVCAVAGARLMNALVNLPAYAADPGKLFELSAEGFSLYGGIIFAVAAGLVCCRFFRLNIFRLGDTFIPFLGISIAIMRVGCFLQGCCFGKVTDLPWGVTFPLLSPAHLYQMPIYGNFMSVLPVHPTELYELAAALLLAGVAFWMLKKKQADGAATFVFIAGFSLFRLFNSYLRVNPESFSAPPYFYPALYLSIAAVCLVMVWKINNMARVIAH
jgi:phosphatidylglycerol:prolipoprotein diacylglycerol transferase